MDWLKVSEVFYSIQGEGVTTGVPAVFVRLTACNLLCKSESWVCDTLEVWKRGKKTAFADILCDDYLERLKEGAHLVVTGGEPLLQQERLVEYLHWLDIEIGGSLVVEVETNGTIVPIYPLVRRVKQWNVSPKLGNSGEHYDKRYVPLAIRALCNTRRAWFKFVLTQRAEYEEILQDYAPMQDFDMERVILMPAGETQAELDVTRPAVIELARDQGHRYSDRLHIVAWNKKRRS